VPPLIHPAEYGRRASCSRTEESSILNFPALNTHDAHERPEGMKVASVIMTGMSPAAVREALPLAEAQGRGADRRLRQVADYMAPNVSEKVVRIILSHVSYVRRVVWREGAPGAPG